MPTQFPNSPLDLIKETTADLLIQLPTLKGSSRANSIVAILIAFCGRLYDLYKILEGFIDQLLPDTCGETILLRWGSFIGITKNLGSKSAGLIVVTASTARLIPLGSEYKSSSGVSYVTTLDGLPLRRINPILSLVKVGTEAIATVASTYYMASGVKGTVAGGSTLYNGVKTLKILSPTTFSYPLDTAAPSSSTGSPTIEYFTAMIPVESSTIGANTNLLSGDTITSSTAIQDVDSKAFIAFTNIVGGQDVETINSLRRRIIYKYQNPVTQFNFADIESKVLETSGITRVFIQPASPTIGQVTVYFMRDNDASPIPTLVQLQSVKESLMTIAPAHVSSSQIIVSAPIPVTVNITITGLLPSSETMKESVKGELADLFKIKPKVGQNLALDLVRAAIFQVVDPATRLSVESATLTLPSANVTVAEGNIAVLGTITFV